MVNTRHTKNLVLKKPLNLVKFYIGVITITKDTKKQSFVTPNSNTVINSILLEKLDIRTQY